MAQRKSGKATALPQLRNEAEAAAFWDTHSPEDYPGEFEDVEVRFSRPLIKRGLTVKLNDDTIAQLREIAHERGIGPSTLVRMWILEHLRAETERRARGKTV